MSESEKGENSDKTESVVGEAETVVKPEATKG